MTDFPYCENCEYADIPLEQEPCAQCHREFMTNRTKPAYQERGDCRPILPERHSIGKITPSDDGKPFKGISIGGDEIMRVNAESAWEIKKIYTDYACDNDHNELIVVFGRKERK